MLLPYLLARSALRSSRPPSLSPRTQRAPQQPSFFLLSLDAARSAAAVVLPDLVGRTTLCNNHPSFAPWTQRAPQQPSSFLLSLDAARSAAAVILLSLQGCSALRSGRLPSLLPNTQRSKAAVLLVSLLGRSALRSSRRLPSPLGRSALHSRCPPSLFRRKQRALQQPPFSLRS